MVWMGTVSAMRTGNVIRQQDTMILIILSIYCHDRMERKGLEEERRAKERQLMEEGR